jgi:hypothetical protein
MSVTTVSGTNRSVSRISSPVGNCNIRCGRSACQACYGTPAIVSAPSETRARRGCRR